MRLRSNKKDLDELRELEKEFESIKNNKEIKDIDITKEILFFYFIDKLKKRYKQVLGNDEFNILKLNRHHILKMLLFTVQANHYLLYGLGFNKYEKSLNFNKFLLSPKGHIENDCFNIIQNFERYDYNNNQELENKLFEKKINNKNFYYNYNDEKKIKKYI